MEHELDWVETRQFLHDYLDAPAELFRLPAASGRWLPFAQAAEERLLAAVDDIGRVLTPVQRRRADRIMAIDLDNPGLPTVHRLLFALSEFGWLVSVSQAERLDPQTRVLLDVVVELFPDDDEAAA